MLTKFISGCRMVWDLICGTSWFYKSKTEKVTGGGKSAILPNCCCLLSITVIMLRKFTSEIIGKVLGFAMTLLMAGKKFERKVFSASQAWGLQYQLKWPIKDLK